MRKSYEITKLGKIITIVCAVLFLAMIASVIVITVTKGFGQISFLPDPSRLMK